MNFFMNNNNNFNMNFFNMNNNMNNQFNFQQNNIKCPYKPIIFFLKKYFKLILNLL